MPTNIEKLQQENQAIKAELDALKAITEMTEKEKKKSELESRIQKAKQEAQAEYQQESNQNTCEKIKAEQEKLETFSLELNVLGKEMAQGTLTSSTQEDKIKTTENANPSEEKPWIWASTKNFVSEQWNNVWDREKWKEESGKNALRTAWFLATGVGAIALAYKGIKKIFWSDEEKEAQEVSEDKQKEAENAPKKKMSWRKKWLYIAGGALGLGRMLNKFLWSKDAKSEDDGGLKAKQQNQDSSWWEDNQDKVESKEENSQDENWETTNDLGENKEKLLLTHEEQEATQTAKKMYSEGYMDWYILIKMYQMGFVPKFNMHTWKGNSLKGKFLYIAEWGPFTKILDKGSAVRKDVMLYLKGSLAYGQQKLLKMKTKVIAKGDFELSKQIDRKANILAELHQDLETGKITSLKDIESNPKYKAQIEEFSKIKFKNIEWKVQLHFDEEMKKLDSAELKKMESELNDMQKKAKSNLKELNNKAKADPKQKAKFQAEAKNLIKNYNKKCIEIEQKFWIQLSKATHAEILQLQKESPMVGKIMKANNGIDNFLKKSKAGKFMVGAGVLSLLYNWASGKTSREQVGLEAADLGVWFVPFAGGAYDVWTSITGEGIAGELSSTDRWIRGIAWGASVVLDVAGLFTFGAGNAASAGLKWLAKSATATTKTMKVLNKTGKTIKTTAEVVSTGVKVAGFSFLWYSLVGEITPFAINLYENIDKKMVDDISIQ